MLVPDVIARHQPTPPPVVVRAPVPTFPLPGATPAYPPAPPAITSLDVRRPVPTITLPGSAPTYPPRAPAITVASLDAGRPAPTIVPPGAIPAYRPVLPWLPPVSPPITPPVDVAAWAPPTNPWESRLAQPPVVELPPAATWTSDGSHCVPSEQKRASYAAVGRRSAQPRRELVSYADPAIFGRALASAALAQTSELVFYTARYRHIAFPMGDVASLHGTCTEVVIRAFRALGIDLQQRVHEFRSGRGDPNIDHRRTQTLRSFFTAQGASLPITAFPEDYQPGDIVTYHRPFGRISNAHIAIVSDRLSLSGRPMVIHNRGFGPQLEDALFADRITGHFRYTGRPGSSVEATNPQPSTTDVRHAGFPAMGFSTGSVPRRKRPSRPGN